MSLRNAIITENEEAIKLIVKNKPNAKIDDELAIFFAVDQKKCKAVKALLDAGVEVDARDSENRTPLFMATVWSRMDIALLLLERGADPKNASHKDIPLIFRAVTRDERLPLVEKLLDLDTDPNLRLDDNETPLMVAAQNNAVEIIRLLIDRGADINATDENGQRAIDHTDKEETRAALRLPKTEAAKLRRDVKFVPPGMP